MSKHIKEILENDKLFNQFSETFNNVSDEEFEILMHIFAAGIPENDRGDFIEDARLLRHITRPGKVVH